MKRILFSLVTIWLCSLPIWAVAPVNYYATAEGEQGESLRAALQDIIDGHIVVSYDGLYNVYVQADNKGNNKVWDMYSTCDWTHGSKKCGSYKGVCDCYNREHSVPQSWFNKRSPMVSDAFHVYPTDGKVNGQRSNYPYGECNNGTSLGTQALGRVGSSSFAGYSGVVFEPDDDYKGDFARTYFYMSTRYKGTNLAQTANGQVMFNATADLTNYSIQLLMKWHRDDPVSQKELDRNDAVYGFQHNRNPFIDHPELAEYLWGNQKGNYWYVNTTDVVIPEVDKIVVSPNPARDYIIVEGESGVFSYHIYNVTGTLMRSGEATFDEMLSVSPLTKGVYMLQIIYSGNKKMLKFVVAN